MIGNGLIKIVHLDIIYIYIYLIIVNYTNSKLQIKI